ncbi:hypothetical protein BIW11_09176 [Tropilaelaps mercedesae]|uniref:Uncharacterized protein n=1 Tax=Tropilaelaps mercedesae TaxID=418985 RepID=A0A1V9XLM5_9ACAR|nr:hypothetical protein BIW11_09176 [Tropilaelaps mercedesae]
MCIYGNDYGGDMNGHPKLIRCSHETYVYTTYVTICIAFKVECNDTECLVSLLHISKLNRSSQHANAGRYVVSVRGVFAFTVSMLCNVKIPSWRQSATSSVVIF